MKCYGIDHKFEWSGKLPYESHFMLFYEDLAIIQNKDKGLVIIDLEYKKIVWKSDFGYEVRPYSFWVEDNMLIVYSTDNDIYAYDLRTFLK